MIQFSFLALRDQSMVIWWLAGWLVGNLLSESRYERDCRSPHNLHRTRTSNKHLCWSLAVGTMGGSMKITPLKKSWESHEITQYC